jgi:hypothetical protein
VPRNQALSLFPNALSIKPAMPCAPCLLCAAARRMRPASTGDSPRQLRAEALPRADPARPQVRGLLRSTRGRSAAMRWRAPPRDSLRRDRPRHRRSRSPSRPAPAAPAFRRCKDCTDVATCAIRRALIDVRDATPTY